MEEDMSGFSKKKRWEDDEYYYTPEGFVVFTEKHHLKRGYCCKSNCRHCPFGYNKNTGKVEGKQKN
jgi:hypothetical protein